MDLSDFMVMNFDKDFSNFIKDFLLSSTHLTTFRTCITHTFTRRTRLSTCCSRLSNRLLILGIGLSTRMSTVFVVLSRGLFITDPKNASKAFPDSYTAYRYFYFRYVEKVSFFQSRMKA